MRQLMLQEYLNVQLIGWGCDVAHSVIIMKKMKKTMGCKTTNKKTCL
jgi:hypothetical protein